VHTSFLFGAIGVLASYSSAVHPHRSASRATARPFHHECCFCFTCCGTHTGKGSGSGGEENLSDEDRDDANFFHRFFSQPDFDSSVAAWIKLQAFDQMLDVAPQAVGTWINTELPWERKEDKPQSFEEGFMKLFFF